MTEQLPDLDHFDHDDAWRVGNALVARCHAESVAVTISIWSGGRVFHAALPGTNAATASGSTGRRCLMRRFARSSLEVYEHYARENPEFFIVQPIFVSARVADKAQQSLGGPTARRPVQRQIFS